VPEMPVTGNVAGMFVGAESPEQAKSLDPDPEPEPEPEPDPDPCASICFAASTVPVGASTPFALLLLLHAANAASAITSKSFGMVRRYTKWGLDYRPELPRHETMGAIRAAR
jgi:hypothetical protein